MKTSAQILGEAITKDRVNAGKSQEDVAKEVGVTQQAFSGWESGASLPRSARLTKLHDLFGPESETAAVIEHIIPNSFQYVKGNILSMSAIENGVRDRSAHGLADRHDEYGDLEPRRQAQKITASELDALYPPDNLNRGIVREMHDALTRAADDVRFARQALDRTAEQIQRAITKLPKQ